MDNTLSSTDKNLINKLIINSNTEYVYSEDMNTLIFNNAEFDYNDKPVLYRNIKLLLDKFYFVYKENMTLVDNYICRRIADFIIGKFIPSTNMQDFPKTLFNPVFIDFLAKENLFFEEYTYGMKKTTIFNNILASEKNHFNITYHPAHKTHYIAHAKKLKSFLNYQLLTYIILNNYEIHITVNFLKLMSDSFTTRDPRDELYTLVFELFEIFYNGIANMVLINSESVEFYQMVYNNKACKDINNSIGYYKNILTELGKMDILTNHMLDSITSFNINNFKDSDIRTATHLSNIKTYIGSGYNNFKTIFTPILLNILKSSKTNIHHKTTVILSIDYFKAPFVKEYINIFNNMEKYNTSNGFRFKIKIRTKILTLIKECLINYPGLLSGKDINNSFITLYTNHVNSIIDIVDELIDEIKNNPLGNNKMMLMKYLIYLNHAIGFNEQFYTLFKNNKDSLYYFKIIEQYYTIFKSVIKNKLYTQLSILRENTFLSLVELGSWKIVDSVFSNLYNNLDLLSQNEIFIDTWVDNKFFYNKDIFNKTCSEYGQFNINDSCSVSNLLEKLSGNIENKIKLIDASADTYDEDIPDEFQDPIMITPIKHPIEIPSVQVMVDQYTIYNHLIFNETNPFTNESLTVNDLEIYNNKPEVKERAINFMNNFNTWKKLHIKTVK